MLVYLTSRAGYAIAEQYVRALEEVYERLVSYPKSGAPRPELGPQARLCLVAPYVVIYDIGADTVVILRVLHGHRDITRALLQLPQSPEG
jgi:toxin ParE1/3/4